MASYTHMIRMFGHTLTMFMMAGLAFGQTFEVASIKPSAPGGRGMSIMRQPGGRFTTTNISLKSLITFAYDLRDHQVTGGPNWLDSDRFDIVAKPEGDVPAGLEGNEKIRIMLQALLADRFKLAIHRETKEMPVYLLAIAKSGPKLQESPSETKGPQIRMGRGELTGHKIGTDMIAKVLSGQLGRNVVDRTGLKGSYEMKLDWTPDMSQAVGPGEKAEVHDNPSDTDGPSIFTALQEQLGLKLEPSKAPVEMVVIDHVEKAAEN